MPKPRRVEMEVPSFLGLNTALSFSEIDIKQSPRMLNAFPRKIGSIGKRPGTKPLTTAALGSAIEVLCNLRKSQTVAVGAAPTLAAVAGSNTLPTATYFVRYTYVNDNGETQASAEASQAITLGQALRITVPAIPYHAKSIKIYISTVTNTEKLEVTTTSLVTDIITPLSGTGATYPTTNTTVFTNEILATSGTTLYSNYNNKWNAATMTNALNRADIDFAQFKDENGKEVLVITDGGSLKEYTGTAVQNITPAADKTDWPTNDLATLNASHKPIGCIVHNTRLVLWDGSDTIWHSLAGYYDYIPLGYFQRFVRENDYVVTCVSYSGTLLVFLRRHVGVLFGDGYNTPRQSGDWTQDFLDTAEGCMNGNTVQTVTFPDGRQELFYLSDNGVSSVYTIDTLSLDTSARYSTRSVTQDKINWSDLGVTKSEWEQAVGKFYNGQYWLIYPKDGAWNGLMFDTSMGEWYPFDNIQANSFYHDETQLYYAGDAGHLRVFDEDLYSDWDQSTLTTGTPINWYWYSKLMTPRLTGFDHFWDVLMIEARQWLVPSTLDVEVNTYRNKFQQLGAIKTAVLIVGVTQIGEAQLANPDLTDFVNNAKRIETFVLGQYAQTKLSNNRDEPMEIYFLNYEIRQMTKY